MPGRESAKYISPLSIWLPVILHQYGKLQGTLED